MKYLLLIAALVVMANASDEIAFPHLAPTINSTDLRQTPTIYCYSCSSAQDSRCNKGSSLTDAYRGYCISPYDRCGKVYGKLQFVDVVIRGCSNATECGVIGSAFPGLSCINCFTNYCNSSVKLNSTYLAIVIITMTSFFKYLV